MCFSVAYHHHPFALPEHHLSLINDISRLHTAPASAATAARLKGNAFPKYVTATERDCVDTNVPARIPTRTLTHAGTLTSKLAQVYAQH